MKSLQELYQEFKAWREAHPDSIYIVQRSWINYDGEEKKRYIVVKGIERYRFFGDVVILTINGEEQLSNPIICDTQHHATQLARKLNAQYVHDNEPELFAESPTWQEAYATLCKKNNLTK